MTYALALFAAVAYGVNWVLQQHEAAQAPTGLQLHPVRLVEHLFRHKLWLAGLAALIVGSLSQEAALASGSLPIVETLLVLSIVFALLLSRRVFGQIVNPVQWVGGLMVCGGLAAFLSVGNPTPGHGTGSNAQWVAIMVVLGGIIVGLCVLAWHRPGRVRAATIATASSLTFGLSDAMSKALFNAGGGHLQFVIVWQLYGFLGAGAVAVGLSQIAYNAAPLPFTLPYLAVGEPIGGLIAGMIALKVHFAASPGAVVGESIAAAAIVIGSLAMGRVKVLPYQD